METLKKELKEQIIDVLNLEDMHPEDIEDSASGPEGCDRACRSMPWS